MISAYEIEFEHGDGWVLARIVRAADGLIVYEATRPTKFRAMLAALRGSGL